MYDSVRFYFVRSLCIAATLLIVSCGDPERDRNPNLQADPKRLAYFEEDYESSRRSFRNSADEVRKKYKGVLTNSIPVSDKNGQGLTIDSVYVPAQTKKNGLVVITSGIHGSEAAAGAAAQRWILSELLSRISLEETGILLIHSLNPYGFKNFRRTSENNVDLNRNCHPDPSSLAGNNPTYAQVNDFLNPEEPASFRTNERSGFRWKTLLRILRFGRQAFRSAVAQGQYEFPKGIFFGGNSLEPNHPPLNALIRGTAKGYRGILLLDFHTGIGARGELHLISNRADDVRKGIIGGFFPEDTVHFHGEKKESYAIFGNFTACITEQLASEIPVYPVVIEYGTINSETISGSFESLRRIRAENQGFHHGFVSETDETDLKRSFRELFFPSSPVWRNGVLSETERSLVSAIPRFQEFMKKEYSKNEK